MLTLYFRITSSSFKTDFQNLLAEEIKLLDLILIYIFLYFRSKESLARLQRTLMKSLRKPKNLLMTLPVQPAKVSTI